MLPTSNQVLPLALAFVAVFLATGCKRNTADVSQGSAPSVSRAPRMAAPTGPTTQEIAKESRAKLLEGYYDLSPLGNATAYTAPDGEHWNQYPNGMLIHELRLASVGTPPKLGQEVKLALTASLASSNAQPFLRKPADDPFTFSMGSKKVPQGLSLGVLGMRPGSKRRVFVPQALAYGRNGAMDMGVQPFQDILYEFELLDITGDALPVEMDDLPRFEPMGPPSPAMLSRPAAATTTAPSPDAAPAILQPALPKP